MKKINCWEYKKCGREEGGSKTSELGVCVAAAEIRADGFNEGQNGGRACWALAGTFCGGQVQGVFAEKLINCLECEFFKQVRHEEKKNYFPSYKITKLLGK